MHQQQPYLLAIDIGAGAGAKLAVADRAGGIEREALLPRDDFGHSRDAFVERLLVKIDAILKDLNASRGDLAGIGVATAGLLNSDGSFAFSANMGFLSGANLRAMLESATDAPVSIENDANAGALAEWDLLRMEILYWVFGGGWGGAWVSLAGDVLFPAIDWDGKDDSLHYTAEPGFAIPLGKAMLRDLFAAEGYCFDDFLEALAHGEGVEPDDIGGPCGDAGSIRAESILSAPGRFYIFQALSQKDSDFLDALNEEERHEIQLVGLAGKHISKLSRHRVRPAVETDRLFGFILAEATRVLFEQAEKDGLPRDVPICIGGKPRYALPYFGPSTQRRLGAMGITAYMRPSIIDERGSNANLQGAIVLARRAALKAH